MNASRRPRRAALIAVEGIDGMGKSTQVAALVDRLNRAGRPALATREPTQGPWGRKIRGLALEGRGEVSPEDELDWFLRDRMEHVEAVIRPALRAGKIVVTDRYYFSTMAYQGALGIDPQRIREMNEALFPRPDLVILLRGDPRLGLARIARNRERGADAGYEQAVYLDRVATLFAGFRDPSLRVIDARGSLEEVAERIWAAVEPLLESLERAAE